VVNLREHILLYRVRYMNDCANGTCINGNLDTGLGFLERYFSLIAFSEFVEQQLHRGRLGQSQRSFQTWMQDHREIWHMLNYIRNSANKLKAFRPLEENLLLSTAKPATGATALFKSPNLQPLSEDAIVVKTRSGTVLSANTILKIDHWPKEQTRPASDSSLFADIAGAPNFRRIPFSSSSYSVYAVAQPTTSALQNILQHVHAENPNHRQCIWINVREEPLIYVNGEPYVLRDQHASLRNIKAYTGISTRRLEQMEQRLKDDVLAEAASYSGRILLHSEGPEQHILPIWETAESVLTMREVFGNALIHAFEQVHYYRVPITAEEPPEPADFDAFRRIIANLPSGCVLVFNCQMGVGRSTTGSIIATQILSSLSEQGSPPSSTTSSSTTSSSSPSSSSTLSHTTDIYYKVVSTVVRMLKNGAESKRIVDRLVDSASSLINLRACIEEYRSAASRCTFDKQSCRKVITKGLLALKRYVLLILFESYELSAAAAGEEAQSFVEWIGQHPEFSTVFQELNERKDLEGLAILTGTTSEQDQISSVSEEACECRGQTPMNYELIDKCQVRSVVESRKGAVLAPMTILKFDHFIGCQKMSLPERIEGAPNFRKVPLDEHSGKFVCGLAMPTKDAIARVLGKIGCLSASNDAKRRCLWISMREEPVIFFNGLPYVLRIVKDPITNLEMTGIVSERVELMEERLRTEADAEAALYDGHLLLHEEEINSNLPLGFEIVPRWEAADELCSPAQAYQAVSKCAIDYVRVPVTDEQAPIPVVFDELLRLVSNEAYTDFVFNCQMGRGRTTTGMIITMLFHRIKANAKAITHGSLSRSSSTASSGPKEQGTALLPGNNHSSPVSRESQPLEASDNATFLRGEYRLIVKLCQLLEFGRAAKHVVDECIDACNHMQNLREAIFDFKQRAALHPNHPDCHRGTNYLLRYFYLIAFAEFLLELHQQASGADPRTATAATFLQWISERREITNLAHPDRGELGFH
jgi:protein-tyrosine phosphatase